MSEKSMSFQSNASESKRRSEMDIIGITEVERHEEQIKRNEKLKGNSIRFSSASSTQSQTLRKHQTSMDDPEAYLNDLPYSTRGTFNTLDQSLGSNSKFAMVNSKKQLNNNNGHQNGSGTLRSQDKGKGDKKGACTDQSCTLF